MILSSRVGSRNIFTFIFYFFSLPQPGLVNKTKMLSIDFARRRILSHSGHTDNISRKLSEPIVFREETDLIIEFHFEQMYKLGQNKGHTRHTCFRTSPVQTMAFSQVRCT